LFQKFVDKKDIRFFKRKIMYYLFFRSVRKFLLKDILINIYNFKIYASFKKNKTSHYLLKKCDFDDYHELNIINKISRKKKVFFLDAGCNYGFYSFYTAAISNKNKILSIEASKITAKEFIKNLEINNFKNIDFYNKAISKENNNTITFNDSENDWESSLTHDDFEIKLKSKIKTTSIDYLLKSYNLKEYSVIIKLDIEGNEINALKGGLNVIKNFFPLIIFEISKYVFNVKSNIEYFKEFLINFNYSIYNTRKEKIDFDKIISDLNNLGEKYNTMGNFYLVKDNSNILNSFLEDE
jgi:FkbM family methyltransferase